MKDKDPKQHYTQLMATVGKTLPEQLVLVYYFSEVYGMDAVIQYMPERGYFVSVGKVVPSADGGKTHHIVSSLKEAIELAHTILKSILFSEIMAE